MKKKILKSNQVKQDTKQSYNTINEFILKSNQLKRDKTN